MVETHVINFFGGPGIGKSTTAAELFVQMKRERMNVELVTEYAKDMVWEERSSIFEDQIYIFAKQNRRLKRLVGKVEFIITDSPLLLGCVYNSDRDLKNLVVNTFDEYNNINFFLQRNVDNYTEVGRNETLLEAIEKDNQLKAMLKEECVPTLFIDSIHSRIGPAEDALSVVRWTKALHNM